MCFDEHVVDVPSAEPDPCGEKVNLLCKKNKALAVLIFAGIIIIILGIIFLIVWFGFVNPPAKAPMRPGHFASTNYFHLRQHS